jgi:DNA-binding NtrC family response regulator
MGETEKETKKSVSSKAGQAISGRILVAEDKENIQDVLSRILDFMGFEAVFAGNGAEALSVSQELFRFGFDRP